jgi:hypothetical protein
MLILLLLLIAAFGLVVTGCGGGNGEGGAQQEEVLPEDPAEQPEDGVAGDEFDAEAGPGATLERFVEAAGAGDAEAMWAELSQATRERWGPSLDDFRNGVAAELQEGLGAYAHEGYAIMLEEEIDERWAVAALEAGGAELEDQFAAYAAAAVREDEGWKLELGSDLNVTPLEPGQDASVDSVETVRAGVDAAASPEEVRMWLDYEPLTAGFRDGQIFGDIGEVWPGPVVVVAFASAGDQANAIAWTFTLAGGEEFED